MITFSFPQEIYIANQPTDFRKCFDGLCGEVISRMNGNPLCGALFVFYNKRKDRLKMIVWDRDGYWLFYKRLELGTFEIPAFTNQQQCIALSSEQLHLILSGIELASVSKRKRYNKPQ